MFYAFVLHYWYDATIMLLMNLEFLLKNARHDNYHESCYCTENVNGLHYS